MPPQEVPPGKIVRLELENFKSYKGRQIIGPFYDFTAIIGPNGAGKSNLMDAISFVLGVRTGQLRGAQLKDLIYAFDDSERDQRGRKAFVRLVYRLDSGFEFQFTRTISGLTSEYRVNGDTVNKDEYDKRLKELGILVKARNFLVFQVYFISSLCLYLFIFLNFLDVTSRLLLLCLHLAIESLLPTHLDFYGLLNYSIIKLLLLFVMVIGKLIRKCEDIHLCQRVCRVTS